MLHLDVKDVDALNVHGAHKRNEVILNEQTLEGF